MLATVLKTPEAKERAIWIIDVFSNIEEEMREKAKQIANGIYEYFHPMGKKDLSEAIDSDEDSLMITEYQKRKAIFNLSAYILFGDMLKGNPNESVSATRAFFKQKPFFPQEKPPLPIPAGVIELVEQAHSGNPYAGAVLERHGYRPAHARQLDQQMWIDELERKQMEQDTKLDGFQQNIEQMKIGLQNALMMANTGKSANPLHWIALGRVLRSIYRNNLYAAEGYINFAKYCQDTFGIHPTRAYELARCYDLYLELKRNQPDQTNNLEMTWTQIRLLQLLPENHRESLVRQNCVFLKDGTQLRLNDLLNMTTEELNALIAKLRDNLPAAPRKLIEAEERRKYELERQIKDYEFLQGELQAEISTLNKQIIETNKQIESMQSTVKEKDDLIKEMATKAHEQQNIGAKQERKKIEKDILKLNLQIDSLKQTEEKLQDKLSLMTRLHTESIEEKKILMGLTPEQIAVGWIKSE